MYQTNTNSEREDHIMSRERNKTKKKNRIKKQNEIYSCKAAFVAGVAVLIVLLDDTLGICTNIPTWVTILEYFSITTLFYIILGSNRLDRVFHSDNISKFGTFLTDYSILVFLLERALLRHVQNTELVYTWNNDRFQALVILSCFLLMGVVGSGYLLFSKRARN